MGKKQYYAVRVGRKPGIYSSWEECKQQVYKIRAAIYKGFTTLSLAQEFLGSGGGPVATQAHLGDAQPGLELEAEQRAVGEAARQDSGAGASTSAPGSPQVLPSGRLYRLEFDGASRGNPGPAGAGAVLVDDTSGVEVGRVCLYMGHATNNQAEYTGLLAGLQVALRSGIRRLTVLGDSMLVVKQVKGEWNINKDTLKPLNENVQHMRRQFDYFSIQHIYRESNSTADAISNEAIDTGGWPGLKDRQGRLHFTDVNTDFASYVKAKGAARPAPAAAPVGAKRARSASDIRHFFGQGSMPKVG